MNITNSTNDFQRANANMGLTWGSIKSAQIGTNSEIRRKRFDE